MSYLRDPSPYAMNIKETINTSYDIFFCPINVRKNRKANPSRMNNPETQPTLGTYQYIGHKNTTQSKKLKR